MDENEKNKEARACARMESLEKQNLCISIHLSSNRIRVQVARLIGVGFGFLILILGGFMSIWFAYAVGGYLRWGILGFSIIVTFYLFLFPLGINKIREEDDQYLRKLLKKNNELLSQYESYLQPKKDSEN